MEIDFEPQLSAGAPGLRLMVFDARVVNAPTPDPLWNELMAAAAEIRSRYPIEQVNKRPAIAATRAAYKAFGKEPNRYRPSSEALCRRAVKGLELYRSLALIDLINLLSMVSGHSIGGFDADKFVGPVLTLGVGREGEPYEAIGRGQLNIAGMPVYRDALGGVGTPTSDNDRTKLGPDTSRLMMIVNIYGAEMPEPDIEAMAVRLLTQYASASEIGLRRYAVS